MHDLPDVPALRAHVPPPGGLAALRERLDAPRRARRWLAMVPGLAMVPALAITVAIVAGVVLRRPPHPRAAPAETAVIDRAVASGPVRFYWVASRPASPARDTARAIPIAAPPVAIADAPRVDLGSP